MMKNLRAKLNKQGGFTLIEMLIVVAIIAILIAIAIPMVNKALESAREATDDANERAALGLAMVEVLSEDKLANQAIEGVESVSAYYAIDPKGKKGTLVSGTSAPAADDGGAYGKATAVKGRSEDVHVGLTIKVTYYVKDATDSSGAKAGDFRATWE